MLFSDHQPYLFGHAGYWSKVLAADTHVAMFDVAYRQEDKLTTGHFVGPTIQQPMIRTSLIADAQPIDPLKTARSLEQLLLAKSNPYRDRGAPFVQLFKSAAEYGWNYERLWLGMAKLMKVETGSRVGIQISREPVEGETTLKRNIARLQKFGFNQHETLLAGPAILDYSKPGEILPRKLVIHEMIEPSRVSFLHQLVTERNPQAILAAYTAKRPHERSDTVAAR